MVHVVLERWLPRPITPIAVSALLTMPGLAVCQYHMCTDAFYVYEYISLCKRVHLICMSAYNLCVSYVYKYMC